MISNLSAATDTNCILRALLVKTVCIQTSFLSVSQSSQPHSCIEPFEGWLGLRVIWTSLHILPPGCIWSAFLSNFVLFSRVTAVVMSAQAKYSGAQSAGNPDCLHSPRHDTVEPLPAGRPGGGVDRLVKQFWGSQTSGKSYPEFVQGSNQVTK